MRFLGDENFQLTSLKVLRDAGHDTVSMPRDSPGLKDPGVISRAVREARIILTFDRDFHRRIYEDRLPAPLGIVLFSFKQPGRREAGERLLELLAGGVELEGFFTIVTRQGVDQTPLP